MASPKAVVPVADAVEKVPAPLPPSDSSAPRRVVVFWKGMNPHEKILLGDGSEIVFGRESFATADEKLIKQIAAVAASYGILSQNGEKI